MITERLRNEIDQMLSLKRRPIIEGWTTQQKGEALAGLVIDHKLTNLVEVGVFGGKSLFSVGFALRENGMGTVVGIDPWSLDACLEGEIGEENRKWWTENLKLEDIYLGFLKAVIELGLTPYCRWIRERGEVAVRMFTKESVDLVHIDGNHSELCACRDVQLWHPKIKSGGFIVMDDVQWDGVSKALKILLKAGYKPVIETMEFGVYQKNGAH